MPHRNAGIYNAQLTVFFPGQCFFVRILRREHSLELRNTLTVMESNKVHEAKTMVNIGCEFYMQAQMCSRLPSVANFACLIDCDLRRVYVRAKPPHRSRLRRRRDGRARRLLQEGGCRIHSSARDQLYQVRCIAGKIVYPTLHEWVATLRARQHL